jgi:CelD/BcsL family acetyltransferase involved in cellulose biosynthesis
MKNHLLNITTPAPRDVWRDILQQDHYAMISQTPQWIDSVCKTGPYKDASRLYEFDNGRFVVLPAVRHTAFPDALNTEKSLPHGWGTGGLVASGGAQAEEINTVLADLIGRSASHFSIRPNPLLASQWKLARTTATSAEQHVAHILDLEGGFDEVWNKKFSSSTRNKIRKAEKSGLTVDKATGGKNVPQFYELYMEWSQRRARERHMPLMLSRWLANLREPYSKFKDVSRILGESCRLWIARSGDQIAAAAFLLVWGEHAVYWRSASDKELTLRTRANDLLQKVMIEDACQSGCRYYHMGESGGVASLMHFKSRFGAVEYPYEEYFFGHLPFESISGKLKGIYQYAGHWMSSKNRRDAYETRSDD